MKLIDQLRKAGQAAGLSIVSKDLALRAMAIIWCYGGGPGGEAFRSGYAGLAAKTGAELLEKIHAENDTEAIHRLRVYVKELRENRAAWFIPTLEKLGIRERFPFTECI